MTSECIGFACQGFGCRLAAVRSCQKPPPCLTPRWLQAKAISDGDSTSEIRVKKGKKPAWFFTAGERSERDSPANTRGKKEVEKVLQMLELRFSVSSW